MPGDSSFFKKIFNKQETFTEADLQKADTEYVEAANILNGVDFGAEDFDEEANYKIVQRYNEASKNYKKIHRSLHPEMYEGENARKDILPQVEINQDAKIFSAAEGLSNKDGSKPLE
ncbi:MAG: hypothetical protein WCG20_01590 [bacterium]